MPASRWRSASRSAICGDKASRSTIPAFCSTANPAFRECIEACREALRLLERTGDYWEVHTARYQVAASLYHLGDMQGAIEEAKRNYRSGLELGDEQASGIILDVWSRAADGAIPEEIIAPELARERKDTQSIAQVCWPKVSAGWAAEDRPGNGVDRAGGASDQGDARAKRSTPSRC